MLLRNGKELRRFPEIIGKNQKTKEEGHVPNLR
jgi:hypothetical protein